MSRWVAALLIITISASMIFQLWQLYQFVHAGPRFTAQDGYELCQRVAAMERFPKPCPYNQPRRTVERE